MTAETDLSDEGSSCASLILLTYYCATSAADMHRTSISIAKFNSHVKQMHANANSGFEDEFEVHVISLLQFAIIYYDIVYTELYIRLHALDACV